MRKFLVVGLAAFAVATAACGAQPSSNTTAPVTPTTQSEAKLTEDELKAAYTRSGLPFVEPETMILQPMATIPTLTFNLGSGCSGQIEKPDNTKYGIKVYTRDLSVTIIDVTQLAGGRGKLSGPDIAKVAEKCPA